MSCMRFIKQQTSENIHASLQSMEKLNEILCVQGHFLKQISRGFSENLCMCLLCSTDHGQITFLHIGTPSSEVCFGGVFTDAPLKIIQLEAF